MERGSPNYWTAREFPKCSSNVLSFFLLLYWVFNAVHGLSLVAVSGGYSLLWVCRLLVTSLVEQRLYAHGLQ